MKEILIGDKQAYLDENYPFGNVPALTEEKQCLHCGAVFKVVDYKVFEEDGEEYIYCPKAPNCDGTIIDWMPVGYNG